LKEIAIFYYTSKPQYNSCNKNDANSSHCFHPCGVKRLRCKPHASALHASFKADIVDTAVGAGSFKTLAAALTAAGLVPTLKSAGPFTVFAPTDDAFAKLP
jgi:uncharacterized surface protein with fasciclin (FAS1) repeats